MPAIQSELVRRWQELDEITRAEHTLSNSELYRTVQRHRLALERYYAGDAEFDVAHNTIGGVNIAELEDGLFDSVEKE